MANATRQISYSYVFLEFNGRITRSEFWLKGVLPILPIGILNNLLLRGTNSAGAHAVAYILALLFLWPVLALYTKRVHDRDRSGWFLLVILIPLVGPIWLLVEAGFLRGTVGPNRFGADPLEVASAAAPAVPPA